MRRMLLALLVALPGTAFGDRQMIPDGPTSAVAQSRIIYLNRHGVTLTPGANDARTNRSSIVRAAVAIPPWQASDEVWSQTVACLREIYAPFDVELTETDPGNVLHIEAVFGGTARMLGMSEDSGGMSPFTPGCQIIEGSIVFAFTDSLNDKPQLVCEVMAQEIAHSYGLDHELLPADPMSYLPYKGGRTFQNVLAPCGETTARPCGLPGVTPCREQQNSFALLAERIGVAGIGDSIPPTVAIVSPADGAVVDAELAVTAAITDTGRVKLAVLSVDGVAMDSVTAAPWTFDVGLSRGRHVIEVSATDGANTRRAKIEVVVGGDDAVGCATHGATGGIGLLVALLVIRRRTPSHSFSTGRRIRGTLVRCATGSWS